MRFHPPRLGIAKQTRWFAAAMLATVAAACATDARAVLLAYEGFDYAPGSLTGLNGGTGFAGAWDEVQGMTLSTDVEAGSLSYTDSLGNTLVTTGGKLNNSGETGTSQPGRDFSFRRDGDALGATANAPVYTYFSFLGVRQGDLNTPSGGAEDGTYGRGANISLFDGGCVDCANDAFQFERLNLGENSAHQFPLTKGSDFLRLQKDDPTMIGDWESAFGKSSALAASNVDYWQFGAPAVDISVNATNAVPYVDPEDGEITASVDWQENPLNGRFGSRFSQTYFAGQTSLMVARIEHYGATGAGSQYGIQKPDRLLVWMNPDLNAEPSEADADVVIDLAQIEDRALEIVNGLPGEDPPVPGGTVNGVDRATADALFPGDPAAADAYIKGSAYRTNPAGFANDQNIYSFDRIRFFAGNASGNRAFADWLIDELRVGETYADVTPIVGAGAGAATQVPEPGSIALAAAALVGLAVCRRRLAAA